MLVPSADRMGLVSSGVLKVQYLSASSYRREKVVTE